MYTFNFFHLMYHKWRGNIILKVQNNFLFLAFYHIIWDLEDIQEDLFYLKYLPASNKQPFYAFSFHLLNWAKAIILNVVGKQVQDILLLERCCLMDVCDCLPSGGSCLDKCGTVQVSVEVLILEPPHFFFLWLSSHRSEFWFHVLNISIKNSIYSTLPLTNP